MTWKWNYFTLNLEQKFEIRLPSNVAHAIEIILLLKKMKISYVRTSVAKAKGPGGDFQRNLGSFMAVFFTPEQLPVIQVDAIIFSWSAVHRSWRCAKISRQLFRLQTRNVCHGRIPKLPDKYQKTIVKDGAYFNY